MAERLAEPGSCWARSLRPVNEAHAIGGRLREARKRRGLTQRELAQESGVSLSLIRKLEQGDYDNGIRLETVRKMAVALGVPTSALAFTSKPSPPDRESVTRWEPVRRALEGETGPEPEEEPTLEGVRGSVGEAVRLFRDGGLTDLAELLPALLADADALVGSGTNGAQVDARVERSRIRVIAGSLLVHTWQFTAADEAFALAWQDAEGPLEQIAVTGQQCFALTRQGMLISAGNWRCAVPMRLNPACRQQPGKNWPRGVACCYGVPGRRCATTGPKTPKR